MSIGSGINRSASKSFLRLKEAAQALNVEAFEHASGAQILDCGVHAAGGLEAGLQLAEVCLAGRAKVRLGGGPSEIWPGPWVQVETDNPTEACLLGQYAGWPVQHGEFFAMGSGPMRVKRGKEELLKSFSANDPDKLAIGTLECDKIPEEDVIHYMAKECGVAPHDLMLAIAPTRSIAGCVQVVARSVETSLHKLHELGFDLGAVRAGFGNAPLCPPTPDFAKGIGRTNDAILYGASVCLWVATEDEEITRVGAQIPSCSSQDFGRPFYEVFKEANFDFYKIDPGLFSPAKVIMMNLKTGRNFQFGEPRSDLIAASFATESGDK
ncbi:MAG: methenyltetrahydromethanopterin cyclohydrolase [Planctomycetota bacterium]